MEKKDITLSARKSMPLALTGLLLLFFATAYSQNTKPVFTGTWTLNETKSQLGEGPGRRVATKLIITQDASSMSVERTTTRRNGEVAVFTEKYNFDGSETDNSAQNRQKKSKAAWSADGQSLTVTSVSVFERDGNTFEMKSVEVYTLGADKCLNIENTMSSQRGDFKTTLVYDPAK